MRESQIEKHLVKRCKALGIHCDKFSSPQRRAVPDRILGFRSYVVFVELKATGARPTAAQCRDHARRRAVGMTVCWTDSIEGVDTILNHLTGGWGLGMDKY